MSDIREKPCIVPAPSKATSTQSSSTSIVPAPSSLALSGASAAVVGREAALAGLALFNQPANTSGDSGDKQMADLEAELKALKSLEAELELQNMKEVEEALELEELDLQIAELDYYMTEEEQLERALKESLEESLVENHLDVSVPPPALPSPPVEVSTKPADVPTEPGDVGSTGQRNQPKVGNCKENDFAIVPLSDEKKKQYVKYWSRFVATPQNADPVKHLPSVAPAPGILT